MKIQIENGIDITDCKRLLNLQVIDRWFASNKFISVSFERGRCIIYTGNGSNVFLIKENQPFKSYYRHVKGHAIVVFEILIKDDCLRYNCYCPIWLFGLFLLKCSFRSNAPRITKYLVSGFDIHETFYRFIESRLNY